jgi:hypothetical protein
MNNGNNSISVNPPHSCRCFVLSVKVIARSGLTSRAQAQPPSGTLNGMMTNKSHKSIATGRGSGLLQFNHALRAFHRWFSGLMRFPRIRPVGFRLYTTEPNSFRNPPDRSNACSDLLGIVSGS